MVKVLELLSLQQTINDGGVLGIDSHGNILPDFPIATLTPGEKLAALYNYNEKTYFTSLNNFKINSIKISDTTLDEKSWSRNGYNGNSYFYAYQSVANNEINDSLLEKKKTFCWPNPVQSSESFIRYSVSEPCNVSVNIFNMAGNFIKSFSDNQPNINHFNEVTWDVSKIESGVYYAIVKAEKGSISEAKTVKIMVIK